MGLSLALAFLNLAGDCGSVLTLLGPKALRLDEVIAAELSFDVSLILSALEGGLSESFWAATLLTLSPTDCVASFRLNWKLSFSISLEGCSPSSLPFHFRFAPA